MQIYLGSLYINDFNRFGRVYQVRAQADAPFRSQPEDILQLKTRNRARSEEHTSELQSLMRISYAVFCLKNNTLEVTGLNLIVIDSTLSILNIKTKANEPSNKNTHVPTNTNR